MSFNQCDYSSVKISKTIVDKPLSERYFVCVFVSFACIPLVELTFDTSFVLQKHNCSID